VRALTRKPLCVLDWLGEYIKPGKEIPAAAAAAAPIFLEMAGKRQHLWHWTGSTWEHIAEAPIDPASLADLARMARRYLEPQQPPAAAADAEQIARQLTEEIDDRIQTVAAPARPTALHLLMVELAARLIELLDDPVLPAARPESPQVPRNQRNIKVLR
jgi:hypothetical protein